MVSKQSSNRKTGGDIRSSGLGGRSQALEGFSKGNFWNLGTSSLARSGVDIGIAPSGNIGRVDVQSDQSLEVEFLLLESIFVRVLVELESNELNHQLFQSVYDRNDKQSEQDVGDSGQVVSTDGSVVASESIYDQWLEGDPNGQCPSDEFGISTQVTDDVFVFPCRGNDGSDGVSPKDGKHHEKCC